MSTPSSSDDPRMLEVTERLRVPISEFQFRFSRSGGPGGQNVNKVNSRATLRWHPADSPQLPAGVRHRFLERYGHRLDNRGWLQLSSQRYRDQRRNVADCLERLRIMLANVATPPARRRATRRTRASVEARLRSKQQRARKKRLRQDPSIE